MIPATLPKPIGSLDLTQKTNLFFNKTYFTWYLKRLGLVTPSDTACFDLGPKDFFLKKNTFLVIFVAVWNNDDRKI